MHRSQRVLPPIATLFSVHPCSSTTTAIHMASSLHISDMTASRLQHHGQHIHRGSCDILQRAIVIEACRVILALAYVHERKPSRQAVSSSPSGDSPSHHHRLLNSAPYSVQALSLLQEGVMPGKRGAKVSTAHDGVEASPSLTPPTSIFSSLRDVKECLANAPHYAALSALHMLKCPNNCLMALSVHPLRGHYDTAEERVVPAVQSLLYGGATAAARAEVLLLLTDWLLKERGEDEMLVRSALDTTPFSHKPALHQGGCPVNAYTLSRPVHTLSPVVEVEDTLPRVFPELFDEPSDSPPPECGHQWFRDILPRWSLRAAHLEHAAVWYDVAVLARAFNQWCLRRGFRVLTRMAAGDSERTARALGRRKEALPQHPMSKEVSANLKEHRNSHTTDAQEPDARTEGRAPSPPTADRATRGPSVVSHSSDEKDSLVQRIPALPDPTSHDESHIAVEKAIEDAVERASSIGSVPSLPSDNHLLPVGRPRKESVGECADGVENTNAEASHLSRLEEALLTGSVGSTGATMVTISPVVVASPEKPSAEEANPELNAAVTASVTAAKATHDEDAVREADNEKLRAFTMRIETRQRAFVFFFWRDKRYYQSVATRYICAIQRERVLHRVMSTWRDKAQERAREKHMRHQERVCETLLVNKQESQLSRALRVWRQVARIRQFSRRTTAARAFQHWKRMLTLRQFMRRDATIVPLQLTSAADAEVGRVPSNNGSPITRTQQRELELLHDCLTAWHGRFLRNRADAFRKTHVTTRTFRLMRDAVTRREHEGIADRMAIVSLTQRAFQWWQQRAKARGKLSRFLAAHGDYDITRKLFFHWHTRFATRKLCAVTEQEVAHSCERHLLHRCFVFWKKQKRLRRRLRTYTTERADQAPRLCWNHWKARLAVRQALFTDQNKLADAVYTRELTRLVVRTWHRALLQHREATRVRFYKAQMEHAMRHASERTTARIFYHWRTKAYLLVTRNVDARRALPKVTFAIEANTARRALVAEAASHVHPLQPIVVPQNAQHILPAGDMKKETGKARTSPSDVASTVGSTRKASDLSRGNTGVLSPHHSLHVHQRPSQTSAFQAQRTLLMLNRQRQQGLFSGRLTAFEKPRTNITQTAGRIPMEHITTRNSACTRPLREADGTVSLDLSFSASTSGAPPSLQADVAGSYNSSRPTDVVRAAEPPAPPSTYHDSAPLTKQEGTNDAEPDRAPEGLNVSYESQQRKGSGATKSRMTASSPQKLIGKPEKNLTATRTVWR